MPRTRALRNFSVLAIRRKGVSTTRTPLVDALVRSSPSVTVTGDAPGPQPVTRLPFTSGFEAGNFSEWDVAAGDVSVVTTQAAVGSRSSQITATTGASNDNYLERNFGDHPSVGGVAVGDRDLWVKFQHRWSSDWSDGGHSGLQKVMLLNIHNPSSGRRRFQLTFNLWTPTQGYFCELLRWNEDNSFGGTLMPNVSVPTFQRALGRWEEFVFRVRMNTPGQSNGILQVWTKAEGDTAYVQRVDRSDINYRDSTSWSPNRIIQSNYQPENVLSGQRWWDDWYVGEEPVDVSATEEPDTMVGPYSGINLQAYPIYRIDMSDGQYSTWASQGATITHEASGAWDGGPCARITPPTTSDGGYSSVCHRNNLNRGGALAIRQLNLRFELQFGSAYGAGMQGVSDNKFIIVHAGTTNGSPTNHRPMVNLWREGGTLFATAIAAGTLKQFNPNPPPDDWFSGSGRSSFYFGDSGTTGGPGNKPIVAAGTWVTMELFLSAVPITGFPNGCMRVRVTGRNGAVYTTLTIPWNYDGWSAVDYINEVQVLGGYHNNNAGAANANKFFRIAGVTYAANQPGFLGPRPGFLL